MRTGGMGGHGQAPVPSSLSQTPSSVVRHLAEDGSDGRFTSYHRYLDRVLYKRPD